MYDISRFFFCRNILHRIGDFASKFLPLRVLPIPTSRQPLICVPMGEDLVRIELLLNASVNGTSSCPFGRLVVSDDTIAKGPTTGALRSLDIDGWSPACPIPKTAGTRFPEPYTVTLAFLCSSMFHTHFILPQLRIEMPLQAYLRMHPCACPSAIRSVRRGNGCA